MAINKNNVADVLREKLLNGEVNFTFIKKDGSRRVAKGTLDLDRVPEQDKQFKGDGADKEPNPNLVSYYDIEKLGWRCCKTDSIVEVEGEEVV